MAEDSQLLAQLQSQVTSLQAEMVTRSEIQSTHEAVDRLTQMVQLLMNDCPKNPEKQPTQNSETHSPNRHTLPDSEPHPPNPPPVSFGGESHPFLESSHFGEGFKPKTVRLEFPRFDGDNPETWCCRAEQFFEMYCTPDAQCLSISAFHMDGKDLVWFQELKAINEVSTRTNFIRAIQIKFGRGPYDDPMETLSKLKQECSLEKYKNQFDILALKVHRLPDEHKLSCFLVGLKDEIRLPVRMFNPNILPCPHPLFLSGHWICYGSICLLVHLNCIVYIILWFVSMKGYGRMYMCTWDPNHFPLPAATSHFPQIHNILSTSLLYFKHTIASKMRKAV
jgi:hypothetical protein